jgi:glycosyltransferase involved in cell wall biosynthesis
MAQEQREHASQARRDITRLLYLVWGEDIGRGGIFDNQVGELLLELQRRGCVVDLLVGIPLPTLVKSAVSGATALSASLARVTLKLNRLERAGIRVSTRRLPLALSFYSPFWAIPLYSIGHVAFLRRLIREHQIDVVHCRSYHAALLAALARGRGSERARFRIVFDGRALFVEEGVTQGKYSAHGLSFAVWKKIERHLLDSCDHVVSVSAPIADYYRQLAPNAKVSTIRPVVRSAAFRAPRLASASPVWVYAGNLSPDNPWYSANTLARMLLLGRHVFGLDLQLRVLSLRDHAAIDSALRRCGLGSQDFSIRAAETIEVMADELLRAHAGLFPFSEPKSEAQRRVFDGVVGSKTGEYLAAGLPLICYGHVGELASLIEAQRLGCVLTGDDARALAVLSQLKADLPAIRARCLEASSEFQVEQVAARYLDLYRSQA